jgi:ABC-type lipoprotein release transport system permease subunit
VILSRGFLRIRRSARAFVRAPRLSVALLLTIALGVGSNASVYGFLQGLIHPASPVRGAERLVSIFGQDRLRNAGPLLAEEYQQLKNSHGLFDWVGAVRIEPRVVTVGGHSEIATVGAVTPTLIEALSLPSTNGVVMSHRMWEGEFDGRQSAVGSCIRVDEEDFKTGGVAPDGLDGLYNDQSVDLWTAANRGDLESGGREKRDLWVVARLRENVSIHQAQTALDSGSTGMGGLSVTPFTGLAPNMARGLAHIGAFLTFSAAAVFFIACINAASFLLGRALRRTHETCLRVALGATRSELSWELFSDSVVIAVAGGAVGLLLGVLTARALPAFLFERDAERLSFAPHLLPIFTASLICIVVTVICGMMPVVGTVTNRPWMVLQRETGSPSRVILRLRSTLVVGQITVCCMLVICTSILLAGLHSALETGAGHRLGDPILLTVQAQPLLGPEIEIGYFNEVERKARSVGSLLPLAWTARLPGNQPTWRSFRIQQLSTQYRDVALDISWLTPESIQSLDKQPVAGRVFGITDQKYRVAVVNEEGAAELFGTQTAGMVIRDSADSPIEIIGVLKGAGKEGLRDHGKGVNEERRPMIYYGYLNQQEAPSTIRDAHFRVPLTRPEAGIELNANIVSASYFNALDMPLVAGRKFGEDRVSGEGRVAVINREAADLYFNGRLLSAGVIDDGGVRTEVIGVVRSQAFGTFEQHAEPTIYFPMWQDLPARMTLMLKALKWNGAMAVDLGRKIEMVPGRSPGPIGITTLDRQLAQSGLAALRIATLIGGASAAMALILGILGLLSAQGDAERQRQCDWAIRIALGAQRWHIVFLIVKNAGRIALAGTAAGILLSLALLRLLIADIAGIASPPIQVWLLAPLFPAAAVMIASILPARRASAISPSVIMREM